MARRAVWDPSARRPGQDEDAQWRGGLIGIGLVVLATLGLAAVGAVIAFVIALIA